jgi:uncharacterized protein (DUF433 family)
MRVPVTILIEPSALRVDEEGEIRVGATRVTLESLVADFSRGATAEQIAHDFPSLSLAEVYAAVAYYLKHQAELDAYLSQREHSADQFRRDNSKLYPCSIRQRLLTRHMSQAGHSDAPTPGR